MSLFSFPERFDIHLHIHTKGESELEKFEEKIMKTLFNIRELLISQNKNVMATVAEATAELAAIKTTFSKALAEIQAKIQALVDAAANSGNVDPAIQTGIDDLKTLADQFDAIVPDAPVTEPPVQTPPTETPVTPDPNATETLATPGA